MRGWVGHFSSQTQLYWQYRTSYIINRTFFDRSFGTTYFIALSERFIVDWSLLRLSWDHLGFLCVNILLVKLPIVTLMGFPPVGKVVDPPLYAPSSSKIDFKLVDTTFPLDFLDLDFTIPAKLFLISVLLQTWLLPLPIKAKHF